MMPHPLGHVTVFVWHTGLAVTGAVDWLSDWLSAQTPTASGEIQGQEYSYLQMSEENRFMIKTEVDPTTT